ncbi:iron-sulfur cluster biosynthesis transcriptional regulator SufR [compost metagenome]|uniref:Predicted transcriptional regulator, ArsR family n=1 Tax=Pseudomonas jinjuensis TaxID=198616 RepID=A0A1H0A0K0_9PSED|nr:MarR family transcriptional regulator [Pseudomonas jinjuensis]SDN26236.1 Predicted transcriptional regulator, ArsR family [Pseudomonas jinjuensis]
MFLGLGRTQQDLLSALLYCPEGMSIDDLAEHLGVTRTAVRQHLAALERDGLVERTATRPTGRRPQQLHQLTELGREQFPRQYQLLADLLIGEVAELIGHEQLVRIMRELGRKLAGNLERQAVDEQRIANHMQQAGYEAQLIASTAGETEIVAYNCIFHHLASAHPEVCELDLALIAGLAGRGVEHLECMVRGGAVCRFRLKDEDES